MYIALSIILILVGLAVIPLIRYLLADGTVPGKMSVTEIGKLRFGRWSRDENPVAFWYHVIFLSVGAAGLIGGGIYMLVLSWRAA